MSIVKSMVKNQIELNKTQTRHIIQRHYNRPAGNIINHSWLGAGEKDALDILIDYIILFWGCF